jgi:hypothetical protein
MSGAGNINGAILTAQYDKNSNQVGLAGGKPAAGP